MAWNHLESHEVFAIENDVGIFAQGNQVYTHLRIGQNSREGSHIPPKQKGKSSSNKGIIYKEGYAAVE